jgi:uncharacterized protein (TIGR00369 family)
MYHPAHLTQLLFQTNPSHINTEIKYSMTQSTLTTSFQTLEAVFDQIPFNQMLGLKLTAVASDHILLTLPMKPGLIGNYTHGILHGGVISTVLDMAGGMAAIVNTLQKRTNEGHPDPAQGLSMSSTISLHIDYLLPGIGDFFTAMAKVSHGGNKIIFTKMEFLNSDNKIIATGHATYLVR